MTRALFSRMKTSSTVALALSFGLPAVFLVGFSANQGCGDASAQWDDPAPFVVSEDAAAPDTLALGYLADVVLQGGDLLEATLQPLSPGDLRVLRSMVYARHGRAFVQEDVQAYFNAQDWYKANIDYSDELLTAEDHRNVAALLVAEGRPEDASWQQALALSKQTEVMVEITTGLDVINAYMTDRDAVDAGTAPEGFEQPTLEVYKQRGIVEPLTQRAVKALLDEE